MSSSGIARSGWSIGLLTLVILASSLTLAAAQTSVEITIGYYESTGGLGQTGQTMEALIQEFMAEHPHIKVNTSVAAYGAFFESLPVQLAAGVAPDVWLSDGVLVDQYAAQGFALDLTEMIEAELNSDDYFGLEDNRDPNGRIWAFPQGLQSTAFYYNEDMFEAAGVDFPTADWTLNDVRAVARRLTVDKNGDNVPDQYGFRSINHVTEGWFPILRAFGGGALDVSRQRSLFNSPETLEALRFMVDMIHVDGTSPLPNAGFGGVFNWFPQQLVAMQYGLYVRTFGANQAPFNYNVTVVPEGPAGRANPVIVNSWIINNGSSLAEKQAAWEWVKFFSGERAQTVWAELGEAVPINRQVAIDTFLTSDVAPAGRMAFIEGLAYSRPLDTNAVWSEWVNAATSALAPAFSGNTSVNEAALNAHQQVQLVLDSFYGGQ